MAMVSKMEMIQSLVAEGKLEAYRKGTEADEKLISRVFRQVSTVDIKEMYGQGNSSVAVKTKVKKKAPIEIPVQEVEIPVVEEPKETVQEVEAKAEVVESVAKDGIILKKSDSDPMFQPAVCEDGATYKKLWVYTVLEKFGFSKISNFGTRQLMGKNIRLVYEVETNRLYAYKVRSDAKVNRTPCICPCIVEGFIKKYLAQ